MHISLNIAAGGQSPLAGGLILPQLASDPAVSGDGRAGTDLTADTSDTWTYDGATASVSQRQYRLLVDGAVAVPPGASVTIAVPESAAGGSFQMQLRVRVTQAPAIWSPWQNIASGSVAGLPQLSGASATANGETGYSGTVSTDTGDGTLYWMVSTSSQTPALATLKAGDSQPVTATGPQTVGGTALTASTTYYVHFLQEDAAGRDSATVSSGAFTTNAPPVGEPGAFAPGDWSITDLASGGDARLTITALPDDGGAAFKAFFYNIDGGPWISLPLLSPGSADLSDLFIDGVAAEVRLLAENLFGIGPESAPKTITTTTAGPQSWQITDTGDGRFDLASAPPAVAAPTITNNADGTFAVSA